jgi:hypothetical protein
MSMQSTLDDELMRAPLVMKIPLESIVHPQLEIVAEHDAASAALMPTNMSIRDAIAAVAIGRIKFFITSLLPRRRWLQRLVASATAFASIVLALRLHVIQVGDWNRRKSLIECS